MGMVKCETLILYDGFYVSVFNLSCSFNSLPSQPPESCSSRFVDNFDEHFFTLDARWSSPRWGDRQVRILHDCQPSVTVNGLGGSSASDDVHNWGDSKQVCMSVVRELLEEQALPDSPPVIGCQTAENAPSEEEKVLVRRMLADALAYQCEPSSSSPPDTKMPDTLIFNTACDDIDNPLVGKGTVNPIQAQPVQVFERMSPCQEAIKSPNPTPLSRLSTWLNDVSRPPGSKRLKDHSVRPHPYAQAVTRRLPATHRRTAPADPEALTATAFTPGKRSSSARVHGANVFRRVKN